VDVDALRALSETLAAGGERASLHVVNAPTGLHNAKTYFVRHDDGRSEALVGSPNLTWGGLIGNSEAMVVLDSREDPADQVERVMAGIEAWVQHPSSVPVTPDVLAALAAQEATARVSRAGRSRPARPSRFLQELLLPTLDVIEALGTESAHDDVQLGLPTGFADLDSLLGGMQPGHLVVIGSRPGLGKSTLLLDACRYIAIKLDLAAALFALESTATDVTHRVLAAEARVPLHVLRSGLLSDDDWTKLARRMSEIAEARLIVNATSAISIDALCNEAGLLTEQYNVRLIGVDPLQLVSPGRFGGDSRAREIGDVARRLKDLALELNVPVVVTSQLGRGPEQRTDRRPALIDLGESDAIGQVADVVILIHRDDYYDIESPRAGEADLIVAKHRNGPTDTITVAAQLHLSRFVDMAVG
jgi:replicative DNA helicase